MSSWFSNLSGGDIEYAEATNGKEAVEKALEWKPDIILLDVRLPLLTGFDAAAKIKEQEPDIPILFFLIHDTEDIMEHARSVGDGCILIAISQVRGFIVFVLIFLALWSKLRMEERWMRSNY